MSKKPVLFKVEVSTYKKFKGICAAKGITISEMVEKLMEKAVKDADRKKK